MRILIIDLSMEVLLRRREHAPHFKGIIIVSAVCTTIPTTIQSNPLAVMIVHKEVPGAICKQCIEWRNNGNHGIWGFYSNRIWESPLKSFSLSFVTHPAPAVISPSPNIRNPAGTGARIAVKRRAGIDQVRRSRLLPHYLLRRKWFLLRGARNQPSVFQSVADLRKEVME
jgi:hypothetical protein